MDTSILLVGVILAGTVILFVSCSAKSAMPAMRRVTPMGGTRHTELDPAQQYIVMCRGGQRASIAVSILKRHGFGRIYNLGGGYTAYQRAGSD